MMDQKEGGTTDRPKGSLQVRAYKGRPFYEARWRDRDRTDRRRRLGPAWVESDGEGGWRLRRGRVPTGQLNERRAFRLMDEVVAEHEERLSHGAPENRGAIFEEAASAWLEHLRTERRAKPSTLRNYELLLRAPSRDRRQRGSRILRTFGGRHLFRITTKDVRVFLADLDREDLAPRTVNIHRQILHAIFEFSRREESFGLPHNPVAGTAKRPEEGMRPVETFDPSEIRAIAAAARAGGHRRRSGYRQSVYSVETEREWRRINEQDASLFVVAVTTGLRLGELGALRWRDVDLEGRNVTVSRSISAGEESSTKSRRSRVVPLAGQAQEELRALRERLHFTGRDDLVFCRPDGGALEADDDRALPTRETPADGRGEADRPVRR
jgi:integrase